jgi:hypothetical protein
MVKQWLVRSETALRNNRLPAAATVAALRGTLIMADRGVIPAGIAFSGRATPRKIRDASAADILRQAEGITAGAIRDDAARMAEGERLAQQIAAVAVRKGLVAGVAAAASHGERLSRLWTAVQADPDIGAASTHLAGLVGQTNTLILLDRSLPSPV